MNDSYVGRQGSPLDAKTWKSLDGAVTAAARSCLTARRFVAIEGPYGLGLKAVPLADGAAEAGLAVARQLPLAFITRRFDLGLRDVAAFERDGLALDTRPVAQAAIECAKAEDSLVFNGAGETAGLLNTKGVNRSKLSAWEKPGQSANDIIRAISQLDKAGFHGPYALALAPERYNVLMRRYPDGAGTELQHVRQMATSGVFKAAALDTGGLLLAFGPQFASIVIGQDMTLGYVGPTADRLEFSVSESLCLHLREPRAVCVLGD